MTTDTEPNWTAIQPNAIRKGDRVRATATSPTRDDVHEFTVLSVNGSWVSGADNWSYQAGPFAFERLDPPLPTVPGLYRFMDTPNPTSRGLLLDTKGRWWWYDLTATHPVSSATIENVASIPGRITLVNPWRIGSEHC